MKPQSLESTQKLRGGFYTPLRIARFLAEWAVQENDVVLEPSAGDGAFVKAISTLDNGAAEVTAIELDGAEAKKVESIFGKLPGSVYHMDYLDYRPRQKFDAIVGNPPFIRYQFLDEDTQQKARALYNRLGLRFTKHTNAWVPFLIKALSELAPGGRLAMVIPAELLNVIHAGSAREFLLKTCSKILVLDSDELFFEGILQRTVLLIAVRKLQDDSSVQYIAFEKVTLDVIQNQSLAKIFEEAVFLPRSIGPQKWMDGLLDSHEREVLYTLTSDFDVNRFSDIASVQVGIVTGANAFFMITKSVADEFDLQEYVRPMFGRSSHVRGLSYSARDHEQNRDAGLPCLFVDFSSYSWENLSRGARKYIQYGEEQGLHLRYKTRIRDPWWKVPSIYATNVALLKRANKAPRLISNEIQALTTDTAYRIKSSIAPRVLTSSWLNSLTLLACELGGRTYGGGVLELVPSEIRSLPVPLLDGEEEFPYIDSALRAGVPIEEILSRQNNIVAANKGFDPEALKILEQARIKMFARRTRNGTK